MEDYSNAGGCFAKHPFNKGRRDECESNLAKNKDADTDRILADAVLAKTSKVDEEGLSPIQITGIVFASLMSIAIMVVIIKRVKSKKLNN